MRSQTLPQTLGPSSTSYSPQSRHMRRSKTSLALMLMLSSQTDDTTATASKAGIKAESIITTITRLDSVTSAISVLSARKKGAAPGSIPRRNKTIQKPNSSLETSADSIPKHPILAGVLMKVIGSILLILRVILSMTWKTPLIPCSSTIIAIIAVRRTSLMNFQLPLSSHQSILYSLILPPALHKSPLLQWTLSIACRISHSYISLPPDSLPRSSLRHMMT
jgi:hypothetical protein